MPPLGRLRVPRSWRGSDSRVTVTGGGLTHDGAALAEGTGSFTRPSRGVAAKLKAPVRSPVTPRRHFDRLGTSTPKRVSTNRSIDVWSNMSEHTNPPRVNGETTSIGTRKPSPIGPAIPPAAAGSGDTGTYSPLVPFGGHRRRDVVEEAAVLVPGDEQRGLAPH